MSPSVLIADDNQVFRNLMKEALKVYAGVHSVREVGDGKEAIESVRENKPDLIILDLSMPNVNGIQAARVLKSIAPEVPLVLCTMHEIGLAEAAQAGFDAVVSKADGLHALAECVVFLLENRTVLAAKRKAAGAS